MSNFIFLLKLNRTASDSIEELSEEESSLFVTSKHTKTVPSKLMESCFIDESVAYKVQIRG